MVCMLLREKRNCLSSQEAGQSVVQMIESNLVKPLMLYARA